MGTVSKENERLVERFPDSRGTLDSPVAHAVRTDLPVVYLARHGETPWSLTGQHNGLTDLPLTERGERNAKALASRLNGLKFSMVLTSPLQRAARTLCPRRVCVRSQNRARSPRMGLWSI